MTKKETFRVKLFRFFKLNNKDKLKDLPGGQGSGPKPLGSSGSLKLADDGLVGAKGKGFSNGIRKKPICSP